MICYHLLFVHNNRVGACDKLATVWERKIQGKLIFITYEISTVFAEFSGQKRTLTNIVALLKSSRRARNKI